MPGLIAILGEQNSETSLDPLLKKVEHRGICRKFDPAGNQAAMAVLDGKSKAAIDKGSVALDGYMVFLEEDGKALQGEKGEKELCSLIKEFGPACLENMEGEFTLACTDENDSRLIARDPLGIRPLYYAEKNNVLYLAPEIKALLGLNVTINEVPPGTYLNEQGQWVKYYKRPEVREFSMELAEAEKQMRCLLRQAVAERINDANKPGVYLSGGLDSSVIAVLAAELSAEPISTYTVGVEGSRDIEYAAQVADRIGSVHHVHTYSLNDILAVLPEVIYHLESFDCAYVRSAIPNYIAARFAAADGRRVMLTGEGSDEMFAGYSYLKSLESVNLVEAELEEIFKNLSRTGLQRVDRMNAAHGLDCRVPFLKPALLDLVRQFPMSWKLHDTADQPVDKWILRHAFVPELGEKVAWRKKEQFDQGSGSADLLASVAEEKISDSEFAAEAEAAPVEIRNKEELYYYRIFREYFPERVLPLVGRWTRTS